MGEVSSNCEPIWQLTPSAIRLGKRASARNLFHSIEIDAELVVAQAGRDVRMGAGIDVGIHAQGEPGFESRRAAIESMSASSPSDSQLKLWMPDLSAYSTSSAVFPTPEKTTFRDLRRPRERDTVRRRRRCRSPSPASPEARARRGSNWLSRHSRRCAADRRRRRHRRARRPGWNAKNRHSKACPLFLAMSARATDSQ